MHPPDGITTARLNGTAHRLLREKADDQTCAAELTAISSDPRVLGWAAGMALGAWRVEQTWGGDRVAALLLAAGGDPDVCEEVAAAQGCAGCGEERDNFRGTWLTTWLTFGDNGGSLSVRSASLTRKRSLVQTQYRPPDSGVNLASASRNESP